jgi:hypothetical protein
MPYLKPSRVRFVRISDIKGPALLIPHARPEDVLLIGSGDDPMVCFLAGRWKGESFRQRLAENWEGMAVEDLQLRVDINSAMAPNERGKHPLTAVRSRTGAGLFVRHKEDHFTQTIVCEVATDLGPGSDDTRIGFTRWKLVVVEGDDEIEIFAYDLDAEDEPASQPPS